MPNKWKATAKKLSTLAKKYQNIKQFPESQIHQEILIRALKLLHETAPEAEALIRPQLSIMLPYTVRADESGDRENGAGRHYYSACTSSQKRQGFIRKECPNYVRGRLHHGIDHAQSRLYKARGSLSCKSRPHDVGYVLSSSCGKNDVLLKQEMRPRKLRRPRPCNVPRTRSRTAYKLRASPQICYEKQLFNSSQQKCPAYMCRSGKSTLCSGRGDNTQTSRHRTGSCSSAVPFLPRYSGKSAAWALRR